MGLSRLITKSKMAILMALSLLAGFAGSGQVRALNGPHHGGGHLGGMGHGGPVGGFAGGGHFGGYPGTMAPTWGNVFSSAINSPNNWGSVFSSAINGPNNWGRILSNGLGNPTPYYGGYPGYGYGPGFGGGWYNGGSVLAMPGYGRGFGYIPGLAVVSPGWAGYPYWGNYGYGYGYPYWGYSNFFVNTGFWPNNGFGWGWNDAAWTGFNNGMAMNWGLLASINEILQRGNARFGPARPVKQVAARNRKGKGQDEPNAIVVPPAANGNGLNAIAPAPVMNVQRKPMDPLKPEEQTLAAIPPPADAQMQMAMAMRPDGRMMEPTIRPRAKQPPRPRPAPGEGPKPKALFPDAATIAQREQWVMERLQGGDRLARNGLYAEAREKYQALVATMADQPAPWLRLAQLEVLAGNAEAAQKAWHEAVKREAAAEPGYSKRVTWSGIADLNGMHQASVQISEWTARPEYETLKALKATLPEPSAAIVARGGKP